MHMRTEKKFREEHYNLYTQGIRTEADCREYTNLEGIILAMSMVKFNENVVLEINHTVNNINLEKVEEIWRKRTQKLLLRA